MNCDSLVDIHRAGTTDRVTSTNFKTIQKAVALQFQNIRLPKHTNACIEWRFLKCRLSIQTETITTIHHTKICINERKNYKSQMHAENESEPKKMCKCTMNTFTKREKRTTKQLAQQRTNERTTMCNSIEVDG